MLIGHMRAGQVKGAQALDPQRDALLTAGVDPTRLYEDQASGKRYDRPGPEACLGSLRTGEGTAIDTAAPDGRPMSGVFAAPAEFERGLAAERTRAGLGSARARDRRGGRPCKMTPVKLRLAQAATGRRETGAGGLCAEPGITRQTLYRHMGPQGRLRPDGEKLLRRRQAGRGEEQGPPAGARGSGAGERDA